MKKIFSLMILTLLLFSCTNEWSESNNKKVISNNDNCNNPYILNTHNKKDLLLKWVIVSDETKNVTSPIGGIISYLNCNAGDKVNSDTLIAQVKPDFNNPNIINLNIQKSSLLAQKSNIEALKNTTISNLDNQIKSTEEQIQILEKNIDLTKKSSNLSKKDLEKQIKWLEDTLVSLENNLELLKKAKKEALEKIDISENSLFINIKNISGDNLLKIDEVFWITEENEHKNDRYEDFLSAKNKELLLEVKAEFKDLNNQFSNIDNLDYKEVSWFLSWMLVLDQNARDAIKESIVNVNFPQTQIDSLYTMFLNYTNSLSEIKNSWDSLENSKSSIETNYDTQISSLENQIDTTKNNLENLQTNKVWSVDTWLELQLSNLESQLKTLKTNLNNLEASKKSQIINFDNQILQLNQSISSLNSSLAIRNIYSGVNWVVKQKLVSVWNNIGTWMPLCQIIPNNKSIKIKIYSPVELNIWDKLSFSLNWKDYEVVIQNALVYKDALTQNFVYESNYLDRKYFKEGEILNLKLINNIDKNDDIENSNKKIIPVSYVENKINWNFVKIKTSTWIVEKKVDLWEINWNYVELIWNLEWINEICK